MLKFLATETNGQITIQQVKHKKLQTIGSFVRSRHYKGMDLKQVANVFLSNLKYIPMNWSNNDGTISENLKLHGNKYIIATKIEEVI